MGTIGWERRKNDRGSEEIGGCKATHRTEAQGAVLHQEVSDDFLWCNYRVDRAGTLFDSEQRH